MNQFFYMLNVILFCSSLKQFLYFFFIRFLLNLIDYIVIVKEFCKSFYKYIKLMKFKIHHFFTWTICHFLYFYFKLFNSLLHFWKYFFLFLILYFQIFNQKLLFLFFQIYFWNFLFLINKCLFIGFCANINVKLSNTVFHILMFNSEPIYIFLPFVHLRNDFIFDMLNIFFVNTIIMHKPLNCFHFFFQSHRL